MPEMTATKKRLVDVNEVKQKLRAVREWFVGHPSSEQDKLAQAVAKLCIEEIDKIKPVDAVEVVHGRWDRTDDPEFILGDFECSECEHLECDIDTSCLMPGVNCLYYCPNCGAKMDGERRADG